MFKKKRNCAKKPDKTRILTRFYRKKEHNAAIASSFHVKNRAKHSQLREKNVVDFGKIILFLIHGVQMSERFYVECPIKSTVDGSEVSATCSKALAMQGTSESVSSISYGRFHAFSVGSRKVATESTHCPSLSRLW